MSKEINDNRQVKLIRLYHRNKFKPFLTTKKCLPIAQDRMHGAKGLWAMSSAARLLCLLFTSRLLLS